MPEIQHIQRAIPPLAHGAMYIWHKYWSRKTWNVISEYIQTYCPEGGIVLDPFVGSGVTAIEALKLNRKAIVCDLNPIATEIIRSTIQPIKEQELLESFDRVQKKVRKKIQNLYRTLCRNCKKEILFDCAVWVGDECREIRYKRCHHCDDRQENALLIQYDRELISQIEQSEIKEWYPTAKLYYPNGQPFKEKQKYESIDELFTKRNLYALALLMDAIEQEEKKHLNSALKICFSSMSHLCSKMNPVSKGGHFTPFSSAWIQHSYWYPSGYYMEQNVWDKYESSMKGHQGFLKAKAKSNPLFRSKKIGKSIDSVLTGKADIYIHTGSCLDLLDWMGKKQFHNSIDYVFTDPPYDASIQFGELSYMWVQWLRLNHDYLLKIEENEIVRNERQEKDFEVYSSLLRSSFQKIFRVLKEEHYCTLTFHSPSFQVRNATIRAGSFAGFDFQKIHHQELIRSSPKSLGQPFGSAQGDFYLRFFKPSIDTGDPEKSQQEKIDERRFENIVVQTTLQVLAERSEPTPYTHVINYIDPVLAKNGFFSSLITGLTIESVLKKHLDEEFCLVDAQIGGSKGKLWWLRDTSIIAKQEIPLTERVEQTVYRKLHEQSELTFTDIWNAVSIEFPNSLTPDSSSIKDILKVYAKQKSRGKWQLQRQLLNRVRQHNEIIRILAIMGKNSNFDLWIGKREQSEWVQVLGVSLESKERKKLSEYLTVSRLDVKNAKNLQIIEQIDLIWIDKNQKITAVFEVEATTSMTEALRRGSNVEKNVKKYMVIPEERQKQLDAKKLSPLFKEYFENENWNILYFDQLIREYSRKKEKIDSSSIF